MWEFVIDLLCQLRFFLFPASVAFPSPFLFPFPVPEFLRQLPFKSLDTKANWSAIKANDDTIGWPSSFETLARSRRRHKVRRRNQGMESENWPETSLAP